MKGLYKKARAGLIKGKHICGSRTLKEYFGRSHIFKPVKSLFDAGRTKKVKAGISPSRHFGITNGEKLFKFLFLWLSKQFLAGCDAFFV